MVSPLGAGRSPTDEFLVFFGDNFSLDIQLVYAQTIEAYTGFFVEVAAGGASVVGQRHVSCVARLHDAACVVRRQAVAGQGYVHHGGRHVARVPEDKKMLLQGIICRDVAEVVQGVGEGDACCPRVAGLVGLVAMGAGGESEYRK